MNKHIMSEFNHGELYYKVTNRFECHNGYQYHEGSNLLTEPFAKTGSCVPGGLYFTNLAHISRFFTYGVNVREVRIPEGSQIVKVGSGKWRTDHLWLGHRWGIEEFIRHHVSDWDVRDWCWISRYPDLSEGFLREFADRVDWDEIRIRRFYFWSEISHLRNPK